MGYYLRTVLVLCFVYLSLAKDMDTNKDFRLESRLSDDVKEYISMLMADKTEKHDRDIQDLKVIIDSQEKKIKHLESDNRMYASAIQDLEKRMEKIEMDIVEAKDTGNSNQVADGSTENESLYDKETNTIKRNNGARLDPRSRWTSRIDRKRRASVEHEVAFFASMTSNKEHLGQGQDVVFDNAVTNVGNAYNSHHGTFVAPTAGTYVFAVTLFHHSSLGTTAGSWGNFMVNGQTVAKLHVTLEQTSQTIVVKLKAGDDVSVQNVYTDRSFYGDFYSTFCGFLLYEDFSTGQIVG